MVVVDVKSTAFRRLIATDLALIVLRITDSIEDFNRDSIFLAPALEVGILLIFTSRTSPLSFLIRASLKFEISLSILYAPLSVPGSGLLRIILPPLTLVDRLRILTEFFNHILIIPWGDMAVNPIIRLLITDWQPNG